MNDADAMVQKLKGQLQQAQGELKKKEGNEFEGTIDQIKGRANEQIAEARIRMSGKNKKSEVADLKEKEQQLAAEELDDDTL
jgi:hypothetical protein